MKPAFFLIGCFFSVLFFSSINAMKIDEAVKHTLLLEEGHVLFTYTYGAIVASKIFDKKTDTITHKAYKIITNSEGVYLQGLKEPKKHYKNLKLWSKKERVEKTVN